jgi:hypothetical protein
MAAKDGVFAAFCLVWSPPMVRPALLPAALLPAALFAVASPALAQDDGADALRALDNPERIEAMASAIERITAALLATEVGPLVDAVRRADPDRDHDADGDDLPPDATLGDLVRANPDTTARIGDEARVTGEVAGAAARDMAAMLPVLAAMARDMAAQWEQRMADARRRRD